MSAFKTFLSPPDVGTDELVSTHRAISSGWVAPLGPELDAFEQELANYTGSPYVVGLSSGTAAIHLALCILGIGNDDVVIAPSFTFIGTVNPIKYLGAEVIFVGSEETTWNMCPNALEDAIKDCLRRGKRVKAVLAVHLYGMPALTKPILEICNHYNVRLVEDAAESLGSYTSHERLSSTSTGIRSVTETVMTGTMAELGILSFNGNKLITTSGGGALLCKNKADADRVRFLSTQAKDPAPHYQHSSIGYNYRLSNILAAIGRAQLATVDQKINARRANYEYYYQELCRYESVQFLDEPQNFSSNRWLTTITFDLQKLIHGSKSSGDVEKFRELIRMSLFENKIESRPLWKPLHLQPVFSGCSYFGSNLEAKLFNSGLCLPSGSNLTPEARSEVVDVISKVIKSR